MHEWQRQEPSPDPTPRAGFRVTNIQRYYDERLRQLLPNETKFHNQILLEQKGNKS
jgi:hypothetical protein